MSDTVEDVLQQKKEVKSPTRRRRIFRMFSGSSGCFAVPKKEVKVPDTATPDLPHQVLLESVTEAEAAPAKKAEKAKSLLAGFHESFEMNMKLSQMTRRGVNVADLRALRASVRQKKVEDNRAKAVIEPAGVMNSGEKTAIEPPVDLTTVTVPLCGDGPSTESLEVLPDTMKEDQFNQTMSDTVDKAGVVPM